MVTVRETTWRAGALIRHLKNERKIENRSVDFWVKAQERRPKNEGPSVVND